MIRKVKILSNKTPNRSRFCLQSSYFFPRFCAIGFRFAAFFFEGFLALCWVSSASHLLSSLAPPFASIFLHLKCGDFHTRSKTSFRKTLKYGENETNHIFTIDNTNVLKKTFTIFICYPLSKRLKIIKKEDSHMLPSIKKVEKSFKKHQKMKNFHMLPLVNKAKNHEKKRIFICYPLSKNLKNLQKNITKEEFSYANPYQKSKKIMKKLGIFGLKIK